MKNELKLMLFLAMATMFWSCNETSKKAKNPAKTEKTQKKNAEAVMFERLKNTAPVNVGDLEAWMPKTLGGLLLKRTKSSPVFPDEVRMTGWYKRVGDKIITLSIADAAGPGGGMIADKINVFGTEPESDIETQQHRSVNVKGIMARQDYETEKNMTILNFFHNKRFMIMLMAHDHNVEETWALVDELDFDALDKLVGL